MGGYNVRGCNRTRQAIAVIARNAQLQSQLIEDILDVSRIITGKLEIERRPVALRQVIESAPPEAGSIALVCGADAEWLTICVRDSGVGIEPSFLPYVFDRFRQADSRATRAHGGLGLGLAIARHVVDQHGGSIRAESEGPGRGTAIWICLPAAGTRTEPVVEHV